MTVSSCGIDVGTQGVRAAVVRDDGTVLGVGSAPVPASTHSGPGRHEQDPGTWWTALTRAVSAASGEAGPDAGIAAVALDATSGTVVVEDRSGHAVGPGLMYDDARAGDEAALAARVGAPLWDELGYALQPVWALPKIMWLLRHDLVPSGGGIVHQSDHLVRRLTGTRVATDTSNALKSGVDLRRVAWPDAILGELGVAAAVLPEVVLPGTRIGVVGDDAAAVTGLPSGIPVRAGLTDGCAAQIAAGALAPGQWSSALGTTLVVKGSTPDLVRDPSGAVYCHRHPDGGWLPGGASSSGAGAIRAAFGEHADLGALTSAAAALVPVAGVTYPLTRTGERFPFVAPRAHGFVDPSVQGDPATFAALCQAVAFVERLAYDVLGLLGADVSGSVALTGGAAGNTWWNQLRTDVLGRPTTRPASPEAAVGMAVLALAEPGDLTATAARMVRVSQRLEPDTDRHDGFTAGYAALVAELAHRGWLAADTADRIEGRRVA